MGPPPAAGRLPGFRPPGACEFSHKVDWPSMPTPEQVRGVVDAYVDAYRQNSKEALVELFAPDGVWHDPVGAPPHEGREAIGAFWDTAHSMAEKIVLEPKDVVICGPEAAMVFTINAHVGDSVMTF